MSVHENQATGPGRNSALRRALTLYPPNVVPMWHPLRLAEDYAMAAIPTGGRVSYGAARGCHTREVETFGAPRRNQKASRELSEEGVDILFKAYEGKPFSHKGKYYTIPPEVP